MAHELTLAEKKEMLAHRARDVWNTELTDEQRALVYQIWYQLDQDQNSSISRDELRKWYQSKDQGTPDEMVNSLFFAVDNDGDGKLSFDEVWIMFWANFISPDVFRCHRCQDILGLIGAEEMHVCATCMHAPAHAVFAHPRLAAAYRSQCKAFCRRCIAQHGSRVHNHPLRPTTTQTVRFVVPAAPAPVPGAYGQQGASGHDARAPNLAAPAGGAGAAAGAMAAGAGHGAGLGVGQIETFFNWTELFVNVADVGCQVVELLQGCNIM